MFASNTSQVSSDATYIEDVFSTYLYTGNGTTQTITNGIDVTGKGALVWIKNRSDVKNNILVDTARGANNWIASNLTNAQASDATKVSSFSSTGFTVGSDSTVNLSTQLYASWTFRKQPKFFDVVTWTGTFVTNRRISHSLGSVPGFIVVKRTDSAGQWWAYHRSLGRDKYLQLQGTNAAGTSTDAWGTSDPTTTDFGFNEQFFTPASGGTYVAYLFAHNAGGFGLSGTDNVISCGSFTTVTSTDVAVNLGWEPQFILWKRATSTGNWNIADTMRGNSLTSWQKLFANTSAAEAADSAYMSEPTATGFIADQSYGLPGGETVIYIAIRRGPMRTPTSGTSVFSPNTISTVPATFNIGFPLDLIVNQPRNGAQALWGSRLQGPKQYLDSSSTSAEVTAGTAPWAFDKQNDSYAYYAGTSVAWNFRRAPGFFDVVCYTGTGSARTVSHNLGVVPELMIVKGRSVAEAWVVYSATLGPTKYLRLNATSASASDGGVLWNNTSPTSSVFSLGDGSGVNTSAGTFAAWLFATCPGVSKVGSVTHVEPTTVSCGFTPRFVLIKSTASTGTDDWFVFDSARGITSGNDPYLRLNSTGAENTPFGAADLIDPTADGFIMNGFGGGTYIYLAIA